MIEMKTKKIIIPAIIMVVVLIGALFLFSIFPRFLESVGATIFGTVSSCDDTPYDSKCICDPTTQRKISVPWIGFPRWSCENIGELLIDPESPNFETEAVSFVKQYLTTNCSSTCINLECGNICEGTTAFSKTHPTYPETKCMATTFGYGAQGARMANVECVNIDSWNTQNLPASGHISWRMEFFLESKSSVPNTLEAYASSNYCANSDLTKVCSADCSGKTENTCVEELPMNLFPNDYLLAITGGELFSSSYQTK